MTKLWGWLNHPGADSSFANNSNVTALERENGHLRMRVSQLEKQIEFLMGPKERCDAETQTLTETTNSTKGTETKTEEKTRGFVLEMPEVPEKYRKTKFNFGTSKVFESKMITTGDHMSDFQLLNYVTPKNNFQKYLIPANPSSMKKFIKRTLAEEVVVDFTAYSAEIRPVTLGGYKVGIYRRDTESKSWKKCANGYAVINDATVSVISSVGILITEVEVSTANIRVIKDSQGVTCLGNLDESLAIFFLKFKNRDSFTSFLDKTRLIAK